MRVVLDTNVFVSAFLVPGGRGERAFRLAQQHRFHLYTSVPILTETARVLRDKFDRTDEDITAALKLISRASQIVRPRRRIRELDDDPDNRVLECAMTAAADLIVSGDRHLLTLGKYEEISVVRLVDLLRMFPEQASAGKRTRGSRSRAQPGGTET